jgi:hypothetical protein
MDESSVPAALDDGRFFTYFPGQSAKKSGFR